MADRIERRGRAGFMVALACLVVALALGYYLVIALPTQGQARVAAVLQLEELRQARERDTQVNDCLVNAYRTYNATWQLSCEKTEHSLGCLLPTHLSVALTEGLEKTQALCVKQVKSGKD